MAYISSCRICGAQVCDTNICSVCKDIIIEWALTGKTIDEDAIGVEAIKRHNQVTIRKLQQQLDDMSKICPTCGQHLNNIELK